MQNLGYPIKLIKQLFIVLLAYSVCRLLFIFFNFSQFNFDSDAEFLKVIIHGIRFDISAISFTNLPYIFLALLPFNNKLYQKIINLFFITTNTLILFTNIIDIEYFKFTLKRTTFDIFPLLILGDDTKNLIIPFLNDYWYIVLIFCGIIYLFFKANNKILRPEKPKSYLIHFISSLVLITLIIIGARGGTQLKPIDIIHTSKFNKPENANAVLNTPFTIIKTFKTVALDDKTYFTKQKVKKLSKLIKTPNTIDSLILKPNIVLIILESFSKHYVNHTTTPFLDSLSKHSEFYTNARANGKKSIEGVPAIISGIPALTSTPFIQSNYSTNKITSIPSLLNKIGYNSNFYHGGNNGTMGFDSYSIKAGYNNYYGLDEYPYKNNYDGTWGIYDEPYLQYFADECNKTEQPFFNTIFTLSSHHPYKIPKQHKTKFTSADPIANTISYTDFALKQFFEKAKKQPWFKNTLFIFTADHTAANSFTTSTIYNIPLMFYGQNTKVKVDTNLVSHIDILPTIMDRVNYPYPYFAFGTSLSTNEERYNYNCLLNLYQIVDDNYLLMFTDEQSFGLFKYKTDPNLKTNLILSDSINAKRLESKLKFRIQEYNYSLINNKMTAKSLNSIQNP